MGILFLLFVGLKEITSLIALSWGAYLLTGSLGAVVIVSVAYTIIDLLMLFVLVGLISAYNEGKK